MGPCRASPYLTHQAARVAILVLPSRDEAREAALSDWTCVVCTQKDCHQLRCDT